MKKYSFSRTNEIQEQFKEFKDEWLPCNNSFCVYSRSVFICRRLVKILKQDVPWRQEQVRGLTFFGRQKQHQRKLYNLYTKTTHPYAWLSTTEIVAGVIHSSVSTDYHPYQDKYKKGISPYVPSFRSM